MCRDRILTKEKSPGLMDLEAYKWSIIDEKEIAHLHSTYLQELDEIFVEAIKNILKN